MSPLPCSGDSFLQTFRSETTVLPNDELRAAWVVRYALASRDEIDRAVDYATRARFHILFVQVRGRADAYYRSELEPAARGLERPTDEFDPLDYFVKRAHEAGIAVHAWINVFYVWSDHENPPPDNHIVRTHPEWLAVTRDGVRMDELPVSVWTQRGLEGYFVSPGNPDARRHIVNVIEDIAARYAIDGVHLDYVRYPGVGFDYSPAQRTAFELRYGVDPLVFAHDGAGDPNLRAADQDILGAAADGLIDSLHTEWRSAQVDSLVNSIRDVTAGLALSAAVMPEAENARIGKGQNWVGWIQRRVVDFVVPMAYTYEPSELVSLVERVQRMVGDDYFLIGLPVFDGRERYLGYSVSLLRREGILGYSLFSYNELEKEPFSIQFLERVFFGEAGEESGTHEIEPYEDSEDSGDSVNDRDGK
jgi:uncharacterized lipoprotein YddW (UPF0748 family)